MNDDLVINLIWIGGALALLSTALLHRGLSQRGALRLALIWVAVIGAAWGAVVLLQHLHLITSFT